MTKRTTAVGVYRGRVDGRDVEIEVVKDLGDGLVLCEVTSAEVGPMTATLGRAELDRMVRDHEVDWIVKGRSA